MLAGLVGNAHAGHKPTNEPKAYEGPKRRSHVCPLAAVPEGPRGLFAASPAMLGK